MSIDNHQLRNNINGFLGMEGLHIWEGLIILVIILDLVLISLVLTFSLKKMIKGIGENLRGFNIVKIIKQIVFQDLDHIKTQPKLIKNQLNQSLKAKNHENIYKKFYLNHRNHI
jgi:5-bromo-4-chloroindolyl phosphate hydrolysis protein